MKNIKIVLVLFLIIGFNTIQAQESKSKVLAQWRFEQVQHLDGSLSTSVVGQPLAADEKGKPSEPQPYIFDGSGLGNFIQTRNSGLSSLVFSDNVTKVNGAKGQLAGDVSIGL